MKFALVNLKRAFSFPWVLVTIPVLLLLTLIELGGLTWDAFTNPNGWQLTEERYGTVDKEGRLQLWPEGTRALSVVSEGFATYAELGQYGSETPCSGGFIDVYGKRHPLIQWWVSNTSKLSGGLAPVVNPVSGKYLFVDVHGRKIINGEFEEARPFSDGLAAVCIGPPMKLQVLYGDTFGHPERSTMSSYGKGKWGFINVNGKLVIPAQFAMVSDFNAGRASASLMDAPNKVIVIDKTGHPAFGKRFDVVLPFSPDGVAIFYSRKEDSGVYDWSECGLLDRDGNILTKGKLYESFANGSGVVATRGNGLTFADKSGKTILSTKFADTEIDPLKHHDLFGSHGSISFSDGLAPVISGYVDNDAGGKYDSRRATFNFIDKNGNMKNWSFGERVILSATPFAGGYSVVKTCIPHYGRIDPLMRILE